MSKPIPRSLLKHTGTLAHYLGTVNTVKTYTTPAASLAFVRFEPVKQNAMTSLGEMKSDRFVMFYDCTNSTPVGVIPAINDKITFGSETLIARKVTPCYGDRATVHHYEVACV